MLMPCYWRVAAPALVLVTVCPGAAARAAERNAPAGKPAAGPAHSGARVPVLSDAEAWQNMPAAEEAAGQPLPAWVRALAGSLPRTAAAMIDLDYAQRAAGPLPERLRAKLRWIAADANRCAYAKAYARADFLRAGGRAEDIDELPARLARLPEEERLALEVVRRLATEAYAVPDERAGLLFARKLTRTPWEVSQADIDTLGAHLGREHALDAIWHVCWCNYMTRVADAFQLPLERDNVLMPPAEPGVRPAK